MRYEFIGLVGTALIVLSFVFDDQRKIRIFNSIGSLFFIVYGLLIGALSNIVLNGTLLGIHFYKLHKMGKENKYGETSERD